ncbi:MAG: hypothetical protein E7643_01420 [Ruminococcaceae bacterium]|nr:hypothetical protein [Oscillospiraceae bacterium]
MQRSYYGRRRQWRLGTLVVIILLITVFLVSCMAGSNVLWVKGLFGWDSADLAAEETIRTLDAKGTLAERLSATVMRVTGESIHLYAFATEGEAATLYRSAVLNTMLLEGYSKYTGNGTLIKQAAQSYPRTSFVTLIPKEALEEQLHALFGGSGTGHGDAGAFEYLDRVGMYTTAAQARETSVKLHVTSLEETENAYRLRFRLSLRGETSDVYSAHFQKKDGGAFVWKMLQVGV